ncbi:MAG: hypothetical protein H0T91_09775 [Propionibacteriaceae bacterium]|nr:hypothetical protein [Propionibacteriaceae bacterium]
MGVAHPRGHVHRRRVYWHPVAADHDDHLGTREIFPLSPVIAEVRRRFVEHGNRADAAARRFPCA